MELVFLNFIYNLRHPLLDTLMLAITSLVHPLILLVIGSVIWLKYKNSRQILWWIILALAIQFIIVHLCLKPLVVRLRPFEVNTVLQYLGNKPSGYSFPSGHTSAAFTIFFMLYFVKSRYCKVMLILACLVGFSRLYLYVHYPSDVFVGILMAYLSAYITYRVYMKRT